MWLISLQVLLLGLLASTAPHNRPAAAATLQPPDPHQVWSSLVSVSVEVEGSSVPLYEAADGSGRRYFEAREGARYAIRLSNRTDERLGTVVIVDGLNVISGERERAPRSGARSKPGRMYVLDPWDDTTIQGWRTSLDDVRRFTFVDEAASYAARAGKANGRMGWIEVLVYRERPGSPAQIGPEAATPPTTQGERDARRDGAHPTPAAEPQGAAQDQSNHDEIGEAAPRGRSYPGTGWGEHTPDSVVLVEFEPASRPAQHIVLRYEYRHALVELGILPPRLDDGDRLAGREEGRWEGAGFVKPPSR